MMIGWTTVSSQADAEKLAHGSVMEKLAACAQVDGPIRSFYLWQGEMGADTEYRVAFKFLPENEAKLADWLERNHPYDIPQWITVEAKTVSENYLNWAKKEAS
jgi:periplasmic divalent cation tolerance protein